MAGGQYLGGAILPDKQPSCDCGGKWVSSKEGEYVHRVPRCVSCRNPPHLLRVRITLPALGKIDIRFNLKGTRLSTLGLADAFLIDVHDQIKSRTFNPLDYSSPKRRETLKTKACLDRYLSHKKATVGQKGSSPSYIRCSSRLIKQYLIPVFGEADITAIQYRELQSFLDSSLGTMGQRVQALQILRAVIRDERKNDRSIVIPEFPELPETRSLTNEEIMDVEDQAKTLAAATVHVAPLRFGAHYAVRPCEIRGLRWSDLDFIKREITIRRHFSDNEVIAGRKSAGRSNDRYNTLTFDMDEVFDSLIASIPRPITDDYVFRSKTGNPLPINALAKAWKKACRDASVPHKRWYASSRHTTLRWMSETHGKEAARALGGHTSSKTTDRYTPSDSREASRKLTGGVAKGVR